jgi:hypothetical protein
MKRIMRRRPSGSMVVAIVALVVAASGTAIAAVGVVNGDKLIAKRSLSGNRLRMHTLTGGQIDLKRLGTVLQAKHAATADSATSATSADSATSATLAARATSAVSATTASRLTPRAFQDLSLGPGWGLVLTSPGYSSPYVPGFYLDREGFVHLRGAVERLSGSSTLIATLPSGARPAGLATSSVTFAVPTAARTVGIVVIGSDGTVTLLTGNATFVSLDGITFPQGN